MIREAPVIETARLRLRGYRADDFPAIAAMVSDPVVMRHFGGQLQSREESWRRMISAPGMWALIGCGYWAVERLSDGAVIGQVGIADFKRDMEPSIEGLPEAGWMFAAAAHGQGYAGEAVTAALTWSDANIVSRQTVAIITADNGPSIRLAERMGFASREPAVHKGEPILLFRRAVPTVAEA